VNLEKLKAWHLAQGEACNAQAEQLLAQSQDASNHAAGHEQAVKLLSALPRRRKVTRRKRKP